MSEEERLILNKFTSGYFVSSVKENKKWNNIEQQYRISKEIYEDIEQLQLENKKYKEVFDKLNKLEGIRLLTMYFEDGGEISVLPYEDILDILKEVE